MITGTKDCTHFSAFLKHFRPQCFSPSNTLPLISNDWCSSIIFTPTLQHTLPSNFCSSFKTQFRGLRFQMADEVHAFTFFIKITEKHIFKRITEVLLVSKQKEVKFLKDRKHVLSHWRKRKQSKTLEGARVFPQERPGEGPSRNGPWGQSWEYIEYCLELLWLWGCSLPPSIYKQSRFKSEEVLSKRSAPVWEELLLRASGLVKNKTKRN